jgi:hypothetical protein
MGEWTGELSKRKVNMYVHHKNPRTIDEKYTISGKGTVRMA